MVGTVTEALKHIKAELATLRDAPAILALCRAVGYQWRARQLDPVTTVHLFLRQILHGNTAWSHLSHLAANTLPPRRFVRPAPRLPLVSWSSCCGGRPRSADDHHEGRWRGHRTFLIDGSTFSLPDTPERQEELANRSGQRPGCGFPVAHLLALFHAGTGFLLEVLAAPWHTHDMAQVATLHAALRPGDVLVGIARSAPLSISPAAPAGTPCPLSPPSEADCGFHTRPPPHYPQSAKRAEGASPLPLVPPVWCHRPTRGVGQTRAPDPPAWMTSELFAALPAVLGVRELRYRVAQAGFRTQTVTLVTTLLESDLYPADALAELYQMRWQVESNLRHLKQTMGLEVLHGQSLAGVLKELTVFALVYNLVRVVMLAAASGRGVPWSVSASSMPGGGSAPCTQGPPCPRWWSIPTGRTASSPAPLNVDRSRTRFSRSRGKKPVTP